jgi:hypothetical protein
VQLAPPKCNCNKIEVLLYYGTYDEIIDNLDRIFRFLYKTNGAMSHGHIVSTEKRLRIWEPVAPFLPTIACQHEMR